MRNRNKTKKPDTRYIECGKHKKRKWAIVCIHLASGSSRKWIPSPTDNPRISDWMCPRCAPNLIRMLAGRDFKNIRPVCIMCIQKLRAKYDPTYPALN